MEAYSQPQSQGVHLYMAPPSPHHFAVRSPYILASPPPPEWRYLRGAMAPIGYLTPTPPEQLPPPTATTAGSPGDGPAADRELIVMRAKDLTQHLIMESDLCTAAEVLKAGLEILGHDPKSAGPPAPAAAAAAAAGASAAAAASFSGVKLVHPDEFKNPSTFLKIYGDPLCFSKLGPLPRKDKNGNWECHECGNVNFPRRFRCNMCQKLRSAEGDQLVSEYAAQVYERYQMLFREKPAAEAPQPSRHKPNKRSHKRDNDRRAQPDPPALSDSDKPHATPQSSFY